VKEVMEADSDVAGDSVLQSRALEACLAAERYQRWLADMAIPYLGANPIELGSGLGNYAQWWLDNARISGITLVERDSSRLSHLRARFEGISRVHVTDLDIFSLHGERAQHTSLIAYNFLEHVEHDSLALRAAHRLCQAGAPVVIFVPAFPFAFGEFDRRVGHFRRYTRASLGRTFLEAGLIPESIRYVNAPGLLTWFVGVRLLHMSPTDSRLLRLWDAVVVPITRSVESRVNLPFGQSVLGVARTP
jgi:hypothetical protein